MGVSIIIVIDKVFEVGDGLYVKREQEFIAIWWFIISTYQYEEDSTMIYPFPNK